MPGSRWTGMVVSYLDQWLYDEVISCFVSKVMYRSWNLDFTYQESVQPQDDHRLGCIPTPRQADQGSTRVFQQGLTHAGKESCSFANSLQQTWGTAPAIHPYGSYERMRIHSSVTEKWTSIITMKRNPWTLATDHMLLHEYTMARPGTNLLMEQMNWIVPTEIWTSREQSMKCLREILMLS